MANRYETSMEARLAARVAELEAQANRVCQWEYDEVNDSWDGTCGGVWKHGHIPSNDGPEYCPRCGGKIEVTP